MKDDAAVALITAGVSLIVSLISGVISVWNRRGTDKNAEQIQNLKGAIDRDLERLRAKLARGQNISATQWNAEFAGYQAIWKAIVTVRPLADKLVNREGELQQIGLTQEYLSREVRLEHRKSLAEQFVAAAKELLSAIHDNAPFYPAPIRNAANKAHKTAIQLVGMNLSAITEAMKGNDIFHTQEFYSQCVAILSDLFSEIDQVEVLIRERLAVVQVTN